jgi:hypothetical protein
MADSSSLNTISSSKYDIYTKLLDLLAAGEYATAQDEFDDVDFLKAGLLGYVTEATAMSIRDSAFHKMMVYRESFLSSAIIPSSVYGYAKMFNIDVIDATPSSRYATISISLSDIATGISRSASNLDDYRKKYGISGSSFMIIDKSNPIIAGSTYYALEHSLVIFKSGSEYIVRYCTAEQDETTSFGTYSSSPLTSYISNGSMHFRAKIYQYRSVHSYKTISGSTFMDVKSHEFSYSDGQLCGMRLEYSKGNESEEVALEFSNLTSGSSDSASKTAYYSLSGDGVISIDFASNAAAGLPQPGGKLDLTMFLTEGSSGNVSYVGTAIMQLAQDDYKSLAIGVILDQDYYTGGTDQSTLQDIKTKIIRQLSTRNTIITESDMNTWFAAQSELLSDISQSKITFRKETDDLMKRTYIAELVLRDGVKLSERLTNNDSGSNTYASASSSYMTGVVPTNTIDVHCSLDSSDGIIRLTQNDCISYDSSTGEYSKSSDGGSWRYKSPFELVLNTKYNNVSYYYTDIESSTALNAGVVSSIIDGFNLIPNTLSISKQGSTYTFAFSFTSDVELDGMTITNAKMTVDTTPITPATPKFELTSDSDGDGSDDSATKEYTLKIIGEYESINNDQVTPKIFIRFSGDSQSTVALNSEVSISLDITVKNGSTTEFIGKFSGNDSLTLFKSLGDVMSSDADIRTALPLSIYKIMYATGSDSDGNTTYSPYGIEFADGTTTYVSKNANNANIFTIDNASHSIDMASSSKLIIDDVEYDYEIEIANENGIYTADREYVIKSVPVIASYWMDEVGNKDWLIKQLNTYIDLLKDNSDKLETSTFFNMKFRNTYGISKRCSSTTTQLRMMMRIYLNSSEALTATDDASGGNKSLENEIRDYIRIQVDKSNDLGELIVSKIIMATQAAYYDYINRIDFNGINGTFAQYVKKSDSTEDNNADPLEWFSLDETIEGGTTHLQSDITFEYV